MGVRVTLPPPPPPNPTPKPTPKVGDRCEVNPGGKRGEVKFVGRIPAIAPGWWIGVQYDEPVGKNDGTCKGKRFFECPPNFGGFLRPDKVTASPGPGP